LKRARFLAEDEKPFQWSFSLGSLTLRASWNFAWCCEERGVALRLTGDDEATAERDPLPMMSGWLEVLWKEGGREGYGRAELEMQRWVLAAEGARELGRCGQDRG